MSFLSDAEIVIEALEKYYRESVSSQQPVINQEPLEQIIEKLNLDAYIHEGGLDGKSLADFLDQYLATTTRVHHPEFVGHQVAVPHYTGALGSLIDGFTNNPMGIYELGPGATSIEYFVVNWMLEKIGWQPAPLNSHAATENRPHGGGILTHGGTLANLTALAAARNQAAPEAWEMGVPHDLALLTPAEAHYSIARAAAILGIGQKGVYQLEVDENGTILPERLMPALERLQNDGKRPIALVANAAQTGVGTYDPLDEIGEFCNAHRIWFHVDGAHGASALLSEKYKHLLKGVQKADSLTWDAHKMLRTPSLCAASLYRDHHHIESAFQQEASYLFHEKNQPGIDLVHLTFECTKSGLALKLFLVLGALGERGLGEYIERQWDLALQTYEYIQQQPDFECAVCPQSNIVCFRITGSDQKQLQIRDALIAQGHFYLTSSSFRGKRYLRLTLMNPDTTLEDIQRLIHMIRKIAEGVISD